jgi:hypothetical protein
MNIEVVTLWMFRPNNTWRTTRLLDRLREADRLRIVELVEMPNIHPGTAYSAIPSDGTERTLGHLKSLRRSWSEVDLDLKSLL